MRLHLCVHSHVECDSQSNPWFLSTLSHFCVSSTGNDLVLTVVLCLCAKITHVSRAIKYTL